MGYTGLKGRVENQLMLLPFDNFRY